MDINHDESKTFDKVLWSINALLIVIIAAFVGLVTALVYDVNTNTVKDEYAHNCSVDQRDLTELQTRYGVRTVVHAVRVKCSEWHMLFWANGASCSRMYEPGTASRQTCEQSVRDFASSALGQNFTCWRKVREMPISGYFLSPFGVRLRTHWAPDCRKDNT